MSVGVKQNNDDKAEFPKSETACDDNDQDSIKELKNILKQNIGVPTSPHIEVPSQNEEVSEMNKAFDLMGNIYGIFKETLAPELAENEKIKREQKETLLFNIFRLLKGQFVVTYLMCVILLICIVISNFIHFTPGTNEVILDFMKFYITSIVAELLAILFFIVKNVFDTSIIELFKDFSNPLINKSDEKKD